MITLIVPTRNRAHTVKKVAPSYFAQEQVSEIIFVIDDGNDETPAIVQQYSKQFPDTQVKILRNSVRRGASESRNIGVLQASNQFILFCDDDEYLEMGYAKTCLTKLTLSDAGAVSGRRVYMHGTESLQQALTRFGNGVRSSPPFSPVLCEYINGAYYQGDIELPFTNAIILTRRELLLRYPFDSKYARGNGYREETDYQMNLFVNGFRILVTNECHSIHLPLGEVRSGGQRTNRLKRIGWSIYYTNYFYSKYYERYAGKVGLKIPRGLALALFAIFVSYRELIRPTLYRLWMIINSPKHKEAA